MAKGWFMMRDGGVENEKCVSSDGCVQDTILSFSRPLGSANIQSCVSKCLLLMGDVVQNGADLVLVELVDAERLGGGGATPEPRHPISAPRIGDVPYFGVCVCPHCFRDILG